MLVILKNLIGRCGGLCKLSAQGVGFRLIVFERFERDEGEKARTVRIRLFLCREMFFGKKHKIVLWGGYKRSPLVLWLAKVSCCFTY